MLYMDSGALLLVQSPTCAAGPCTGCILLLLLLLLLPLAL